MTLAQVIPQIYSFAQNIRSEQLSGKGDEYGCSPWNMFLKYLNLFPPGRVLVMNEHFIGNDIEVYVPVRCTFLIVYILAEKVDVKKPPFPISQCLYTHGFSHGSNVC